MKRSLPMVFDVAAPLAALMLAACGPEATPTEPTTETSPAPAFAAAANTWTAKAPMPTERAWIAAGVANRSPGKPVLYAIGGSDPQNDGNATNVVEAYDFATNTWTTKASLPIPLTRSNGVGLIGGKLYLSGGSDDNRDGLGVVSRLYVYDPARNTWSRKRNMPLRMEQGVTGVINGKLYVLGGDCNTCGPADLGRRLYRYDPGTNSWSSLARCPQTHVTGAGGVINGKFYVAGGIDRDGHPNRRLHAYDPATNTWTTKAPMPSPSRTELAGAVLDGKLYVIGGFANGIELATVQAYDPATNTWRTKAHLLTARSRLGAAAGTLDGQSLIVAAGGILVDGATEAYRP